MGSTPARAPPPGTPALSDDDRRELSGRIGPLAAAFTRAGHRFFLVGGLVRDTLLGHGLTGDIDITTDAIPDQIAQLVAGWADTVWEQGKAFGTIGARRKDTAVEITTHRAESYDSGSRKPHVRFSDDIVTDLGRRDFTVNAMAIEVPGWTLYDPFGGLADLANGVLRTPSEPEGLFSDDPLRMLRAARFSAQLALAPTQELVTAIRGMRPRLAIVSRERIGTELTKLLELPRPSAGVRFLADTGLLGDLLPPWQQSGTAVPAPGFDAVGDLDERVEIRWAILLGLVCDDEATAARCLSALRIRGATIQGVIAIGRAARALQTASADAAASGGGGPDTGRPVARRLVADHGPQLDAATATVTAWDGSLSETFVRLLAEVQTAEGEALRRLPVDGHRVMEVLGRSGPVVGEALAWLRNQQIEHGPLSSERACALLAEWDRRRPQSGTGAFEAAH
ncbi:CCA tRNA nucleotidyltransferase [Candidatus Poriferisodalis sp.]|uniref:CCA tRNA nucleotidyltransferase n=1 Tax=Candidatus Poriferisodalis sp. TaxID=3101277 RepID=UPI003C6EB8EE